MDIESLLESLSDDLEKQIHKILPYLYDDISDIPIGTEPDGKLQFNTTSTIVISNTIDNWAQKYLIPLFASLAASVDKITKAVFSYYQNSIGVSPAKESVTIIAETLGLSGTVSPASYLSSVASMQEVKMEIHNYVLSSMSAGKTRTQYMEGLREIFQQHGLIDRYFKTYAYDILAQYERMANNKIAQDFGLKHARYSGTVVDGTRQFCLDRVGKVFTVPEIKSWNKLSWRGKIEGVDVLVALGGYNCRHHLSYITESKYNKEKDQPADEE